ncbi:MAG TPA: GNAT family N-acetyltransferase [Gaiellaceae bacterium]|nr:GNAT family N-acetyltransferase [Gaiellaceae bacterium]
MPLDVRPCASVEELRAGLDAINHYFGHRNEAEDVERFANWIDVERMHVARDDGRIVGGAGAFTFRVSVPGGETVPAAGVTVVGVLPTHRRRGALTEMMRAQLDDSRARGDALAYLWASEATIYGRFGYGMASRAGSMKLARERAAFARPFDPRGSVRLVEPEEAAQAFPPLYERMLAQRPGLFTRTQAWWETRRLAPSPWDPRTPKNLALLDLDGRPAGYAIYTVKQEWAAGGYSSGSLNVIEAMAPTPEGTRELWRWLLDFDWTSQVKYDLLPVDHPLFLLLAEPRRMDFQVGDGTWVRLLDLPAAMAARSFAGDNEVVVALTDSFRPENAGCWRIGSGGAERVDEAAELALDVADLGSVYLGGFSFADLHRALRVQELVAGAVERADALFGTSVQPWCAEIF